jgi:Ca-activated chloride channel family protein
MHFAFPAGETDLFSGLEEAAKTAQPWEPKSTTLLVLTDGDTVPAVGMPSMPASVENALIVGVGDPHAGSFVDGHQSRQEVSTLQQIAVRLGGTYHNGNEKHLPTDLLNEFTQGRAETHFEQLTLREYALLACGLGGFVYALLPFLLHYLGTSWRPGVPVSARPTTGPVVRAAPPSRRSWAEPAPAAGGST